MTQHVPTAKIVLLLATIALCLIASELTLKYEISRRKRIPFLHDPAEAIYPRLHGRLTNYSKHETNVLLLGGSVLARNVRQLEREGKKEFAFYNLAQAAHSSLDSYHKHNYLQSKGYEFDYVVFYHGINDVRANNVPAPLFRTNYDHYAFYRTVSRVLQPRNYIQSALARSSLAYSAYSIYHESGVLGDELIGMHGPRRQWRKYGSHIKSKESFKSNLEGIGRPLHTGTSL